MSDITLKWEIVRGSKATLGAGVTVQLAPGQTLTNTPALLKSLCDVLCALLTQIVEREGL